MKILVTGGAGFIGRNLCERLLSEGAELWCVDNFYSSGRNNLAGVSEHDKFRFYEHDILEKWPAEIEDEGFNEIYHLACPASPPIYQRDHVYTLKVCFEGTENVLKLAKPKTKVLFASTSEVYGDPEIHPQSEKYRGNVNPIGPRSCYDEGKRVAESLCVNFAKAKNLDIRIARIFNTYGPFMDRNDGRVVSNLVNQALEGKSLTIHGDGKQTRSFQYIDDLLDGFFALMRRQNDFSGPVNLGNPDEVTILELAEEIRKIVGGNLKFEFRDLPVDDPMRRCPDISLAKEKLAFAPKVGLQEGLKKTIDHFR